MTITINKGASNVIAVMLRNVTFTYFLFEFASVQNKTKSYCIVQNTSGYTNRYYQFTIVENATPIATSGQINLDANAQYTYSIYQQASATNLNPALATLLKNQCIAKVFKASAADSSYSGTITNTTYNG